MVRKRFIGTAFVIVAALLCGATAHDSRLEAAAAGGNQPTLFVIELSHDGQQIFFLDVDGLAPAHRQPGRKTAGIVQLTRGFSRSRDLWDWRLQAMSKDSAAAKSQVTIRMLDNTLQEVARWTLDGAFPEAVVDSVKDGVVYEQLVLAHDGLTMVEPAGP